MHLDEPGVADHQDGLAQRLEPRPELLRIGFAAFDKELRAESIGDTARPVLHGRHKGRRSSRNQFRGGGLAPQVRRHAFQQHGQPLPSGVYDAMLPQHIQLEHRSGHRRFSGGGGILHDCRRRHIAVGLLTHRLRHRSNHGENCPLNWISHGLIGSFRRRLESPRQVGTADIFFALDASIQPLQYLRKDHAAVSTGAQQSAPRESFEHATGPRFGLRPLGLGQSVPHGQRHVNARVTIGHGEDVQGVDRLDLALQVCQGQCEHLPHLPGSQGGRGSGKESRHGSTSCRGRSHLVF